MFAARSSWVGVSKHLRIAHHRRFCNSPSSNKQLQQQPHSSNGGTTTSTSSNSNNNNGKGREYTEEEVYRDLENLDFEKAAKILFTYKPRRRQKFGIDWHLVQLISVSIPSLGIYLLAQWAHRLDAKLVLEKKADEAKKAKELEPFEAEKKEKESDPELSEVKERLETLEKAVKEIVGEIKKSPSDEKSKNVANNQEKEDPKNRPDNSHAAMGNPPTAEKATPSSDKQHKHQDSEKTGSHQDKKSD